MSRLARKLPRPRPWARSDRASSDRPPHLLLIVENLPMGQDRRVSKQVPDLVRAGYEVTVITRRGAENAPFASMPGVTLREYPSPREPVSALGYLWEYGVSFVHAATLAARTRMGRRIDVVQLCQPPDIYFPLGRLLKLFGATVVVDQRDLMPELFAMRQDSLVGVVSAVLRWFERRTQRVADETICVNDYLKERLVGAGARPDRVTIVRNGPVLARVDAAVADPSLKEGHRYLCCWVGKMGRQDRLDLVVRAAGHVVHGLGVKDVGFVVLGDGECLDESRALSSELGLDPWVTFPGWVPESTVFRYLATADIGLDASMQEEVSPVKVLEYMAFGVPFVSFDLRETREVGDGAGAFVPPGDVGALARRLTALLDEPDRREELARLGRDRVSRELAWERQSLAYIAVIDRLAERSGGAARG